MKETAFISKKILSRVGSKGRTAQFPISQNASAPVGDSSTTPIKKDNSSQTGDEGQLALDVYQTPHQIVIVAPVAGVKLSDIHVSITEDVLTIKGKRSLEFDIPQEDYLTQECFWGNFSRSIVLPASVDASNIAATFKDGILKVTIPRTERTKTRLIRIKTG